MSGPSSGIGVTPQLRENFLNENWRFIKVQINEDLQMELVSTVAENGTFEQDLGELPPFLEANNPCFILARTDKKNNRDQYRWNIFLYVPDRSPTRSKMLYSSSKSNLKKELGDDFFIDELFGSVPADFSVQGYKMYIKHKEAEAPLTREEEKIKEDREQGVFVGGGGTGGAYAHGVAFPVDDDALEAMSNLKSGSINYVQLTIDVDAERIRLLESKSISIDDLGSYIPNNEPRFHFYKYDHEHGGNNLSSLIFIYSCPDGSKGTVSAPVKMRMLFSSSKANVSSLASNNDMTIDLKLEINNGEDVAESEITNLLHPPRADTPKKINKPTPRGGRRLIKTNN